MSTLLALASDAAELIALGGVLVVLLAAVIEVTTGKSETE